MSDSRSLDIDISRVVAAAARARMPAAAYVVSDVSLLPFKKASVDHIVSISTLDHLPPPLLPSALTDDHQIPTSATSRYLLGRSRACQPQIQP